MVQGWDPFDNNNMLDPTQYIGWGHNISTLRWLLILLLHTTAFRKYVNEAREGLFLGQTVISLYYIDDSPWWQRTAI